MKTKVSKKAIGIFVASAVVLLLVAFMMSEPTRVAMATRASQCKVKPENVSISAGTDVPFPQPIFGGREDITPPRPPLPPTPNPPNPPVVIGGGGGYPWDVLTSPNLPISTPSPIGGQWSPLATPALGGHPPNPIACQLGHEGESFLSQSETRPMDTQTDDVMDADDGEAAWARAAEVLKVWAVVRRKGTQLLLDPEIKAMGNVRGQPGWAIVQEVDAETRRINTVMSATNGSADPDDLPEIINYLNNFKWVVNKKAQRVRLRVVQEGLIGFEPVSQRDRFLDEGDMI
jgi:hypothetical protein